MQIQKLVAALTSMAVVADASVAFLDIDSPLSAALAKRQQRGGNRGGGNNNNNNGNNGQLCLQTNAVQKGSQSAGTPAAQQAQSATDNANFINFCVGETLTDGQQKTGGSCNGIVMGKIPSNTKMVSTVLTKPAHNENIEANKDFDVTLKVNNLAAGSFTDAQATYYSAPQDLNGNGQIIGHCHVTIQDMGNTLTPNQPLDPTKFSFFKGINDAGDGNGNLKATVAKGLPAGNYRVCTMCSASNHQPVLMPVAQRGAQDDCNKFTVGGGKGGGNNNNNNNGGNNNNQNQNQNQNQNNNNGNRGGGKQAANKKGGNAAKAAATAQFPGGFNPQNPGAFNPQNPGAFNPQNPGGGNPQIPGGGNPFGGGGGGFPGFGNPGAATTQPLPGSAQGTPDANSSGQEDADVASKSVASATTSTVAPSAAVPTESGDASSGSSDGSGGNGNGNSSGSGKGGATSNALGGIAAPAVTESGDSSRPFSVNGNSFVSKASAAQRSCDIQRNSCFNAINGGEGDGASTADCDAQVQTCIQELS
ncbi:hypothetical protein C8035_v001486 [Colletotrichum spinosum]|uniref:Ribosomal protein s17 n=1 Tax=Colletotrichum spinosum TaxID=1347390 RepID=A0A4R8Q8S9_9PEZI|nr:hypothetical protein C8035_v001486 [Colletotrichum spinosum]